MKSKKNSSLVLLGVFTLGVTQSYMVDALPETSANLAKESDNESKQQDIDVKQGTDVKSVDSKDGKFLYISDDKISRATKTVWGGTAGVSGLLLSAAAIVVKKTLDSKQDNSNENNEDSERDKEVEKDLDDQKEKADNQDSKDEVKNSDSKSILLPLFIVLGLAVVVGTIVYFVCKSKRKGELLAKAIAYRKETLKLDDGGAWISKVLEIHTKIEKELGKNGLEFRDLVEILKKNNLDFVTELSSVSKSLFDKLFSRTNKDKAQLLLGKEEFFKKYFEDSNNPEKEELFSLLINTESFNLEMLLGLFYAFNKNVFDKIDLTTKIAEILLEDPRFTMRLSLKSELKGRIINFTAAILTGKYKEDQTSFKVNIEDLRIRKDGERISFSYMFENSPVDNLKALLSKYEEVYDDILRAKLLDKVAYEYDEWEPEQQKQEYSNENNVENIMYKN